MATKLPGGIFFRAYIPSPPPSILEILKQEIEKLVDFVRNLELRRAFRNKEHFDRNYEQIVRDIFEMFDFLTI